MNISQNGITLIKKFEGCVLQVYLDAVGVKTLGYGHTGADVNALPVGARISQAQADTFLMSDIARFEKNVNRYDSQYHWSQNEYDALCSFAFNVGSIDQLTANGTRTKQTIADKMLEYNRAGGKVLDGLTNRRKAERQLFLSSSMIVNREYEIGKTYVTDANLYIRSEPNGEKVKHENITANARQQAYFDDFGYAILHKGTRVTCKAVQNMDNSTWIHIPSGWICGIKDNERYVK